MGKVICPRCNTGAVYVEVENGEACGCEACDERFTVADVRTMIASWSKLLEWLDSHPAKKEAGRATGPEVNPREEGEP